MTFQYTIRYNTFSRHEGLTQRAVRVRGHSKAEAVERFYQKYGKIKIVSINGIEYAEA